MLLILAEEQRKKFHLAILDVDLIDITDHLTDRDHHPPRRFLGKVVVVVVLGKAKLNGF